MLTWTAFVEQPICSRIHLLDLYSVLGSFLVKHLLAEPVTLVSLGGRRRQRHY